jgi:hypothetical protein
LLLSSSTNKLRCKKIIFTKKKFYKLLVPTTNCYTYEIYMTYTYVVSCTDTTSFILIVCFCFVFPNLVPMHTTFCSSLGLHIPIKWGCSFLFPKKISNQSYTPILVSYSPWYIFWMLFIFGGGGSRMIQRQTYFLFIDSLHPNFLLKIMQHQ